MNNQLTLGEYISQVFFKETGQGKSELAINMSLSLRQVSLLLVDKLELHADNILRLSKILPISLAEIHSRLLLTYQHQTTTPVVCHMHRDKTILEHQINHTLNSAANNMYLCEPPTILQLLNYDIKEAYSKFGHSICFDVDVEGNMFYITTQYSVKNSYNRAVQFTSTFTPNRSYADCLLIAHRMTAHRNKHIYFSETAKKHNALNTFILDVYINRHKLHVDSLLHIFGCNRAKLNKFIEGNLKLDTSELIVLQDTTSIPFEILKELQTRGGDKETLNDNKQQDMKMNKINAALKALLDEMDAFVSEDTKKNIQEHMEKSIKDGVNKHAQEQIDNAMKAMHLRPSEEAKMSEDVDKAFSLVRKISNGLTSVDEKIANTRLSKKNPLEEKSMGLNPMSKTLQFGTSVFREETTIEKAIEHVVDSAVKFAYDLYSNECDKHMCIVTALRGNVIPKYKEKGYTLSFLMKSLLNGSFYLIVKLTDNSDFGGDTQFVLTYNKEGVRVKEPFKDLVEKRREEELVKSISKVKTLIKEDTITINKLTDKRVNLTANLFNLEDKLTKLRNSNKSK